NYMISYDDWRSDFTIISLMMGNDYLPKLKFIKYESIWKSYFETIRYTKDHLIKDGRFDKNILKIFLSKLLNNIIRRNFNPENYDKKSVVNYLEGLLWCLNMYKTGECSMYDYTYNYKGSPTPADIYYFINNELDNDIQIPRSNA